MKLTLDLHDIYNHGEEIDRALRSVIDEAIAKKIKLVEIIPGKGSGALKKHVLRFLDRKDIKPLYHRWSRTPTTSARSTCTSSDVAVARRFPSPVDNQPAPPPNALTTADGLGRPS